MFALRIFLLFHLATEAAAAEHGDKEIRKAVVLGFTMYLLLFSSSLSLLIALYKLLFE